MKQLLLFFSLLGLWPAFSSAQEIKGIFWGDGLPSIEVSKFSYHGSDPSTDPASLGTIPTASHSMTVVSKIGPLVDTLLPISDSMGLATDSLLLLDPLLTDDVLLADIRSLLDSFGIRKSFFMVDIGVSNRLFSLRNNNFNAQQLTANRIAFTPSVTYYHKSGLGFSAMAFLSSFDGKASFYQYAISPSYDYLNHKNFSFGISYAYYITQDDLSFYATPFKHEFYGYIRGRKGWLRPGFTAGWATGTYQEVATLDTVIFGIPRRIVDTTDVGIKDLALTFSLAHHFDWDDVLLKGDGISLVPQVMVVGGAQQYEVDSKTTIFSGARLRYASRRFNSSSTENTGLRFQSLAFAMNASYFYKKLTLSGGYFLNYYLPETDQPFTHIFSVSAGLTF
jgi:hypothetical protein